MVSIEPRDRKKSVIFTAEDINEMMEPRDSPDVKDNFEISLGIASQVCQLL